jgi:2,4-dienoyl-CoA reductase-like NADH-dependent reductase (Old Yellow Enzyme family)
MLRSLFVGTPDVFSAARLGPIELRNRVIKAATFEGASPKNIVSRHLIEFHRLAAAGGLGMTTVSYVAVSRDGMGAPNEIYVHDAAADGLAKIAAVVHGEGARISAQLGHAGAVGKLPGKQAVGPSKARTLMGAKVAEISRGQIDEVVEQFAAGGRMLAEAGFDAVEIHLGHHYLLSSFMSPKWNKRTDDYGGSVENRARINERVIRAVRDAVGPSVAVIAKMNMVDAVRGGLQIDESISFAKRYEALGALDAIELTGGGSLANPMYLFRGDVPREEFMAILPKNQRLGFKLFGRALLKDYPFEEGYFLPMARQFRKELSLPLILLGGINTVATMRQAMDEGFEFVAMGRALLRNPNLINEMQAGTATAGNCIHCNKCMLSIYSGTRCIIDQPTPVRLG